MTWVNKDALVFTDCLHDPELDCPDCWGDPVGYKCGFCDLVYVICRKSDGISSEMFYEYRLAVDEHQKIHHGMLID